jgi:hypothetical protein
MPQVTNCVGALNKNAPTFSGTCSDGVMLARLTAASARMAPYINTIQPWRMPPQLQGCAVNDFLNVQLAYLPFIDCLNLNFTQFVDGMATSEGPNIGPQVRVYGLLGDLERGRKIRNKPTNGHDTPPKPHMNARTASWRTRRSARPSTACTTRT